MAQNKSGCLRIMPHAALPRRPGASRGVRAIKGGVDPTIHLCNRARAYCRMAMFNKALKDAEEALARDPTARRTPFFVVCLKGMYTPNSQMTVPLSRTPLTYPPPTTLLLGRGSLTLTLRLGQGRALWGNLVLCLRSNPPD